MLAFSPKAQLDNYSTIGSWGANIRALFTTNCAGWIPATNLAGIGTINVNTNSGRLEFNGVQAASENRIAKPLGAAYDDLYALDFDMNIAEVNSGTNDNTPKGIFPVVLSSLNENPSWEFPNNNCNLVNMDILALSCWTTTTANSGTGYILRAEVTDNGVPVTNNNSITLNYGTTYFNTVNVYNNGRGEVFVYNNAAKTAASLVGSFCFSIPSTVRGLTFMQHSTNTGGGLVRRTTGWVDNTNVRRLSDGCCTINLTGNNVICNPASLPATYTLTTTGTGPFTFTVSGGATFTQSGNTLNITNWGTLGNTPKEVTITATALCACEQITTSMIVYVYPGLADALGNFVITGGGAQNGNLLDFNVTPQMGLNGTLHLWEVFTSNAASAPLALIRTPVTTNTMNPVTIDADAAPAMVTGTYYLVRHTVSYPSGLCRPATSSALIYYTFNGMVVINSNETAQPTSAEVLQTVKNFENNVSSEGSVSVVPNPTTGIVNIQSELELKEVVLMDLNGKVIQTLNQGATRATLDLSNLEKGIYLVRSTTAKGTQLKRIVKQ